MLDKWCFAVWNLKKLLMNNYKLYRNRFILLNLNSYTVINNMIRNVTIVYTIFYDN